MIAIKIPTTSSPNKLYQINYVYKSDLAYTAYTMAIYDPERQIEVVYPITSLDYTDNFVNIGINWDQSLPADNGENVNIISDFAEGKVYYFTLKASSTNIAKDAFFMSDTLPIADYDINKNQYKQVTNISNDYIII